MRNSSEKDSLLGLKEDYTVLLREAEANLKKLKEEKGMFAQFGKHAKKAQKEGIRRATKARDEILREIEKIDSQIS